MLFGDVFCETAQMAAVKVKDLMTFGTFEIKMILIFAGREVIVFGRIVVAEPIWRTASVIHSRLLLLGLIMVYRVYDMFNFLFPVTARGISK